MEQLIVVTGRGTNTPGYSTRAKIQARSKHHQNPLTLNSTEHVAGYYRREADRNSKIPCKYNMIEHLKPVRINVNVKANTIIKVANKTTNSFIIYIYK